MQVRWTRKALENLDNAVDYIANDKPAAASNVALKIWNTAQRLAEQPGMGRPGRVKGTRELIVEGLPYILPYTIIEGTVFILWGNAHVNEMAQAILDFISASATDSQQRLIRHNNM